ncbi:uncharacterized protein EAE97_007879 [Botrytis byssoidea]|uniref:Uncharacterized protein n=1 Tax=Botrytis byssoidea TaxID=139641 RepID=A0A9P5IHR0_9HELO|nr:uncharacterized protein EAE97_007879 [Botrytis byssoidea]KAF7936513.1 hypothetical protein EAE97_007879 [Botrytis byssoidea]
MVTNSSFNVTITRGETESPPLSNTYSGKTNVDIMRLLSKENHNTRKMEQERQGRKAMEINQNQLFKSHDNSSGRNKDDMANPPCNETRSYSKMSTTNELKEMKERSTYSRNDSNETPTLKSIFHSDVPSFVGLYSRPERKAVHRRRPQVNHQVGPQETEQQEMNMQAASSTWISDAVPSKGLGKKHREKELQVAMAPKSILDRHYKEKRARRAAEFRSLEHHIVSRKDPESEISEVETNKGDQRSHVLAGTPTPALSEHQAAFELTRERATAAIKNSQIARAAATKVIVESQAVRARVEKALLERLADRSHAESAERGESSRERITKTVIASSVDGSVEDILEMDKNNNKEIAKEATQEVVQAAEQAFERAVQSQDRKVQLSASSPQISNGPNNNPTNTMDINANNTDGEATTKVSRYTGSMDEYKIEFVTEAEDDAENMDSEAEDDWVKVMDYDEDEDEDEVEVEVEEDGWLLA